jgi:hypothetical protein
MTTNQAIEFVVANALESGYNPLLVEEIRDDLRHMLQMGSTEQADVEDFVEEKV